jgi:hypothetical protein
MSGEAVGWAFRKVQMDDPTAKFVLVAICNYADANDKAWPSHNDISRVTGLSKRAVQNSIKKLVDWGVVQRIREFRDNGSENNPTVYLDLESRPVVKDGVVHQMPYPTVQENRPDVATDATLQTTDTKPHKNSRPAKQDINRIEYPEDFELNVWQPYPRKNGTSKKKAWDQYRMLSEENQSRVKAAIPAYAAQMKREGRDETKIKHLQFWLSERIWETISALKKEPEAAAKQEWYKTARRDEWERLLLIYSGDENWRPGWGPAPGKPGCCAPVDLIEKLPWHLKPKAA